MEAHRISLRVTMCRRGFADLPDNIPAFFQVTGVETTFTCVVGKASSLSSILEHQNRTIQLCPLGPSSRYEEAMTLKPMGDCAQGVLCPLASNAVYIYHGTKRVGSQTIFALW